MPRKSTAAARQPKQARSAATKERLLEATIATLTKRGYSATTTSTIAEEADVTRGAIQHHFSSREQLMQSALDYLNDKRCERVQSIISMERDWLNTADFLGIIRKHAFGDFFEATLTFFMGVRNEPGTLRLLKAYDKKVAQRLGEVFNWYFDAPIVQDPEAKLIIMGIFNLIRGFQLMDFIASGESYPETTITSPDYNSEAWLFWAKKTSDDLDNCVSRLKKSQRRASRSQ